MVYLPGIDRICHFLWGGFEPAEIYPEAARFSPSEKRAAAVAVRRYYQYTDGLIGALMAGFGPRDLVVVVSDHGFEARVKGDYGLTGTHDSEEAEKGVIFARGAAIPRAKNAGEVSVNQITPTILAWLGLPVAADMDGRPAAFAEVEMVAAIPTYDTAPIERVGETAEDVESSIIDQLRVLGYVMMPPERRPMAGEKSRPR